MRKEIKMVDDLAKEMHEFIKDLKENIKDPIILDYLLKRTEKLFDVTFKQIEKIVDYKEEELAKIEKKQDIHSKRLHEMENKLKNMYNDIYEEETDFEITCPYCNNKFDAEVDETINEINCPECNNIIELDWSESEDNLEE